MDKGMRAGLFEINKRVFQRKVRPPAGKRAIGLEDGTQVVRTDLASFVVTESWVEGTFWCG